MISVDLRPGECNGGVAVVLRGELGVAGAASAAAVVPAGAACGHEVIAGLAGLEFLSCSGLRVLQRFRMLPPAGRAGGWMSHSHRCDMISAGSSVLRRGFASPGTSAADRVRRSRAACGLSGVYADGSGVVRRRLRGSTRLAFAGALLPECAGRLAGHGGRP